MAFVLLCIVGCIYNLGTIILHTIKMLKFDYYYNLNISEKEIRAKQSIINGNLYKSNKYYLFVGVVNTLTRHKV